MEPTTISCLVVGDEEVGKSCLIACQMGKEFQREHIETDFFMKHRTESTVDGQTYSILIWDSPSETDYYKDIPAFPRVDVLLLCFSIDCRASYANACEKWYRQLRRSCSKASLILVGTKLDLRDSAETGGRQISQLQGRELATKVNAVSYKECSALNPQSVKEVFDEIVYTRIGLPSLRSSIRKVLSFPKFRRKSFSKQANYFKDLSQNEATKACTVGNKSKRVDQTSFVKKMEPHPTGFRDEDNYLMAEKPEESTTEIHVYDEINPVGVDETEHELATKVNQEDEILQASCMQIGLRRKLPNIPEPKTASADKAPPPLPNRRSKETHGLKLNRYSSQVAQPKVKLIVVGDEAVGKTCLLTAYAEGICPLKYVPTETDDCLTKEVQLDGDTIGIGLWDLSGSKDFDKMRPENYGQTDVILICFSVASPATLESVRTRWQPEVARHCPDTPIILVGTKADLRNDRIAIEKLRNKRLAPISSSQAEDLARDIGAQLYIETSALTREGLDTVFLGAVQAAALQTQKESLESRTIDDSTATGVSMSSSLAQSPSSYDVQDSDDDEYRTVENVDQRNCNADDEGQHEHVNSSDAATAGPPATAPGPRLPQPPIVPPHPIPKPRGIRRKETNTEANAMVSEGAKQPIRLQDSMGPADREMKQFPISNSTPLETIELTDKTTVATEEIKIPSIQQATPQRMRILDRCQLEQLYPVTSPQGFCLIINISTYKNQTLFPKRNGSEFDVKRVKDVFTKLNFIVKVHENLTCNEVVKLLSRTAFSEELSNHGCFACFIMAHGAGSSIFGIDGEALEIQSITERFRGNQCHGLRHKPKLFFIQACRGTANSGNTPSAAVDEQESDVYYCPKESDFLLCFASPNGQISLRNPSDGSPFVQTVCSVIEEMYKSEHLLDMLTIADRRLKKNPVYREGSQVFVVIKTLTRLSKNCFLDPELASAFGTISG